MDRRALPLRWPASLLCFATAACGILGFEDPSLSVSLVTQDDVQLEVEVDGRAFRLDTAGSVDVRAPRDGELPVSVWLLSQGDTLVVDSFRQSFTGGNDHWIQAFVADERPLGFCHGNVRAHPLGGPLPDSVFILHGSMPQGAIC